MGTSTDGQLCYGIMFEKDTEFPWDEHPSGFEEWWLEQCGYEDLFEMFDERGQWVDPKPSEERQKEFWDHRKRFREQFPEPVVLVNYCSDTVAMYILAIPRTEIRAWRGYPETLVPGELTVTPEEREALISFCKRFGIEVPSDPAWYLSSYWG